VRRETTRLEASSQPELVVAGHENAVARRGATEREAVRLGRLLGGSARRGEAVAAL
jgi:hypothetical protein